ncbi:flagellar hook assembly protein FlgD [[Erwinia] mediterraneensis]|uniref:flagellar hook assembly protein FlgD n=1 Tax=[Erwinia] mediterraneensis TaxID=2161819 RepID=UPI0010309588|nr:flagellar hook capping FlgD N-terminal domain-containing protein [[Erwinia] mediterraneensis]
MAVSPVMHAGTSKSAAAGTPAGNSIDDITNNFMTLLVAQMANQDPTNPMDNNQLTSQLAQLNTAAGVQQLNSTLNSVGTLVTSMQQMNAADWVGRSVLVEGTPVVSTSEEGNKEFALSLNSDADDVVVTLTDSEGNTFTGHLKPVKAGVHKYSLADLTDISADDLSAMENKTLNLTFSAQNKDGSVPDIVALKKARVESVSFTQLGAVLQLGVDGTASLGDVYMIE